MQPAQVPGAFWPLAYLAVAVLLLASWMGPGFARSAWDSADAAVFAFFNGANSEASWRTVVAALNSRWFDMVPGGLLVALYADWMLADEHRWLAARAWLGVALAAFTVLWLRIVVKGVLEIERISPSLAVPDAVNIETVLPAWLAVKGSSSGSFPGDHCAVATLVALVIGHVCGWRRGLAALALVPLASLPRLMGGGHWLTDIAVGGLASGLAGAALFLLGVRVWLNRARSRRLVQR